MKKLIILSIICLLCLPLVLADELAFTDIEIDGKNLEDRDVIDDLEPGQEIEFELELKNTFPRSSDMTIDDIAVRVIIQDINKGRDVVLESKKFKLRAHDDKILKLAFTIPLKVEHREQYKVVITADGFDDLDDLHNIKQTNYIEIEKERHNVDILEAIVSPEKLTCDRTVAVDVRVMNLGRTDEEDASLILNNADLGIREKESFDLEEDPFDEDFERLVSFVFTLPDAIATGVYPFAIESFYEGKILSDTSSVNVTVEHCALIDFSAVKEKSKVEAYDSLDFEKQPLSIKKQETMYIGLLVLILSITIVALIAMLVHEKNRKNA